ncbi:chromatin assembly complex protein [Rhizoctonia solani 123E]|uniref:Chromatin assembly complex protein n=1 Tax=Rhizoctonia solani 123E TaxID=1423351 RepID=A0A074RNU5_9AGAM|nr:chromatin assembly complex protein [Rhizoctonia solani 123E]
MSVRVKTLEIRWHHSAEKNYSEPIYACDFQPLPANQLKKLVAPRIQQQGREKDKDKEVSGPGYGQSFRMATGGGDNNIRVWMVYPNVTPPGQTTSPQPARVEYLATLSKHTAAVNVVRFSPNGEFIASAGDDGMLAIWSPSDKPVHNFGDSAEELQYEKEHWRPRVVVRATTREVYDLAWSPNGEYIVTGSTDNTARVHNALDGTVVREITEHSHYVQGVAWDPLNEFLATQSSDRSVHVHAISTKRGVFETHAVGKNSRMKVRQTRTPSRNPPPAPRMVRRQSNASDTESIMTSASERPSELDREPSAHAVSTPGQGQGQSQHYRASSITSNTAPTHLTAPLTPATSIASTPVHTTAPMFPPSSSRRSSISSAAAPSPPHSAMGRYGRSPSPMPPLPAIRTPLPTSTNTAAWATKLYGDENFTNFFRRLTFSPDGALMLTPAGQFEDHSHALEVAVSGRGGTPAPSSRASSRAPDDPPVRPKRERPLTSTDAAVQSSVYIYARAGLSSGQNPIAHLPGYKRASVAVKFCPLLFELRYGVAAPGEMKRVSLEIGKEQVVHVDLGSSSPSPSVATVSTAQPPSPAPSNVSMSGPGSVPATPNSGPKTLPLSADGPTKPTTNSVFALPYRMLFAVATQDTVMIYDTQQAGPICMFTNLHYSSFTDMAWAPDGQSLMLASSDGYCSLVVFDDVLPLYHTQQHNLQLHSIAASHSVPHTSRTPVRPSASPAVSTTPLPGPGPRTMSGGVLKRSADSSSAIPTTPVPTTVPEEAPPAAEASTSTAPEPVKKKRRIAPTTISTLDK